MDLELRRDAAGLVQITKTPESQKYEKITKKMQNPPSRAGARKYEKNTEKKTKMVIFGPFQAVLQGVGFRGVQV